MVTTNTHLGSHAMIIAEPQQSPSYGRGPPEVIPPQNPQPMLKNAGTRCWRMIQKRENQHPRNYPLRQPKYRLIAIIRPSMKTPSLCAATSFPFRALKSNHRNAAFGKMHSFYVRLSSIFEGKSLGGLKFVPGGRATD